MTRIRIEYATPCGNADPLADLYYCVHCRSLKCSRGGCCHREEIACFYCPGCQFEVPSSSVKSDRMRCSRNCFECPLCRNPSAMQILPVDYAAEKSSSSVGASASASSSSSTAYYLACSLCHWDSRSFLGWTFPQKTQIAAQLSKEQQMAHLQDVQELQHMQEFYDRTLAYYASSTMASSPSAQPSLPGASLGFSSLLLDHIHSSSASSPSKNVGSPGNTSFLHRLASSRRLGTGGRAAVPSTAHRIRKETGEPPVYAPFLRQSSAATPVLDDQTFWEQEYQDAVDLTSVHQVSTREQRSQQPFSDHPSTRIHHLFPLRMPLKTKRNKRCQECRHLLVKCEPKVQDTGHKMKLMALHQLPRLTVVRVRIMEGEQIVRVRLRMRNPLDHPLVVQLMGWKEDMLQDDGATPSTVTKNTLAPVLKHPPALTLGEHSELMTDTELTVDTDGTEMCNNWAIFDVDVPLERHQSSAGGGNSVTTALRLQFERPLSQSLPNTSMVAGTALSKANSVPSVETVWTILTLPTSTIV